MLFWMVQLKELHSLSPIQNFSLSLLWLMTDHSDLCLQKEEVHRTETCSTGPEVNVHSQPSTPVINVQNHFKQYDCRA